MNPVCRFIEFISDLTFEEYGYKFNCYPSSYFFKCGGCYELVRVIMHFLPDTQIWLSNDFEHCVFNYRGILYDIDGIIDNIEDYHKATDEDMNYLSAGYGGKYGIAEITFNHKRPSDALIEEIMECKIEHLIEACKNMDDTPDYYKQKKLVKKRG